MSTILSSSALLGVEAVFGADFGTQRQAQAVHIADFLVALLQLLEAFEEVGTRFAHLTAEVHLVGHLHDFQAQGRTQRVGGKGGMGGSGREHRGVDQLFASPQAGQRIQAIGQGLGKHQHIGLDAEVFHRPQLAGTPEAHLDFIDHQQHAVVVQHLLQAGKEVAGGIT
jgi:hypothetical protein